MKFKHVKSYVGRIGFFCTTIGERSIKVLDVGNLGDGKSTNLVGKQYVESKDGEYYGLDSNEPLTNKMNLPNQIVGDIHKTEFEDDAFDMVYLGEVIEHTWIPAVMINECRRILKSGGQLVLDTPNIYSITYIMPYILWRINTMGDVRKLTYNEAKNSFRELKENDEFLLQPQHKIFFSPAMIKQILETHGFVIESIGFTRKGLWFTRLFLRLFPHLGQHMCVVARKTSLDVAFADVLK